MALHTRSAFQILVEVSSHGQVPEDDIREQRAYPAVPILSEGREAPPYSLRVLSSSSRTDEAYAIVRYNDLWFYIDNRDLRSKASFTFLLVLLTLSETTEKSPTPILTIRAN